MTGYNNKKMTADQFASTIDEVISILADPKPRINITNTIPAGCSVLVFVSFEVALGPVSENDVLSSTSTTDIGAVDGHCSSTI
jgi:hypothetical protein